MKQYVLIILLSVGLFVLSYIWSLLESYINKVRTRICFKQSLKDCDLAIISLYNGDKKLNFIIDSGSTSNVIDEESLEGLSFKDERADTSKIETYGVGGTQNTSKVVSMYLTTKKERFYEIFYVMDIKDNFFWGSKEFGETIDGILGMDFLTHYNKIIDFDNCIIYSK